MLISISRGNERILRAKCSPGLGNDLIKRIRKRSPKESISWTLEKYIRDPSTFFTGVRVLSDRATLIPELPDSAIRQIVLRIKSQQSSFKLLKDETDPLNTGGWSLPKVQTCTEYVVIQKVRIAGRDKDWEIWGFTKPTTLEDLDSPFFAAGLSLRERVQAMQEKLTGRS
jgi:protein MBA1